MGSANEANQLFQAMSQGEQRSTLGYLVNTAGDSCTASSHEYRGLDSGNTAYYFVACSNGGEFIVKIIDDIHGSTRVFD